MNQETFIKSNTDGLPFEIRQILNKFLHEQVKNISWIMKKIYVILNNIILIFWEMLLYPCAKNFQGEGVRVILFFRRGPGHIFVDYTTWI